MALATHRRIENRGNFLYEGIKAGESGIYPGMLCKLNTAGELVKHNIAEGECPLIIAAEDALQGKNVAAVYTDDNEVSTVLPGKGSVVNVLVASGEVVAIGTQLCSGGNGTWIRCEAATSGTFINTITKLECIEGQTAALTANTLVAARVM